VAFVNAGDDNVQKWFASLESTAAAPAAH